MLTYFYTLDAATGTLRKIPVNASKAWWQGLEDVQNCNLYLHGYGDRKTGQHKGITVLNAITGDEKWQAQELAFYGLVADGVLAYQADKPEGTLDLLNPKTGEQLQTGIAQQEAARLVAEYNTSRYSRCTFPTMYLEGEPYFVEVSNFLQLQSNAKTVKAIEYAEAISSVVVSYYEEDAAGFLDNFVAVYDLEGNIALKVKVGSGLSGIGSDSFFIFNLDLYLLQDKQKLQVYRLTV